jgi:flagellar biosynthesis/type III secretory pathway chaperone
MENTLLQIYQNLQKLTGLHRQLMDIVRVERDSLIQADIKGIESAIVTKQKLIEDIYQTETARLKLTAELAVTWKRPYRELTLPNIIIAVQGIDPKGAEQLRSVFNTLTVLIQRITAQNQDNRSLVERSLGHVHNMKRNILGEATPRSSTYTPQGQKTNGPVTQRIISREA